MQQLGAMDQEYTAIPLDDDKQIIQVTTYEGLRMLAGILQEKAAVTFDVRPSALAEFIAGGQSVNAVDHRIKENVEWYYRNRPTTFNSMVNQALDELRCQNNQGSVVLRDMQQQFRQKKIDHVEQLQKQIAEIEPSYTDKKNRYIMHTAVKTGLGLFIIGGWTAIGLLSWVIDHCHHPWD